MSDTIVGFSISAFHMRIMLSLLVEGAVGSLFYASIEREIACRHACDSINGCDKRSAECVNGVCKDLIVSYDGSTLCYQGSLLRECMGYPLRCSDAYERYVQAIRPAVYNFQTETSTSSTLSPSTVTTTEPETTQTVTTTVVQQNTTSATFPFSFNFTDFNFSNIIPTGMPNIGSFPTFTIPARN